MQTKCHLWCHFHYTNTMCVSFYRRLIGVLEQSQGQVVLGGESDASERYIAPTIVTNVKGDDQLMKEELFGPILPILAVNSMEEAIQFVNKM